MDDPAKTGGDLIDAMCRDLRKISGRQRPVIDRKFHKHDEYRSFGLTAPEFRSLLKKYRPRFLGLPLRERLLLSARFLKKHTGELGHAGLHILALSVKELAPEHFSFLDGLPEDFRSWSQADHLALEVMQPLLEKYPNQTLILLSEWSLSPIRWKRRMSVVTFTRKASKKGKYAGEVIILCDRLIRDSEDIVQKGVGWALKDNLRSAPEKVFPYLKELRRRGVPSTITSYAIRNLKGPERQEILAIKKATSTGSDSNS